MGSGRADAGDRSGAGRSGSSRRGSDRARGERTDRGSGRPLERDEVEQANFEAKIRRLKEIENAPKSWGGVARRGVGQVREGGGPGSASAAFRSAAAEARASDRSVEDPQAGEWILVEEIREEAESAVGRGRSAKPSSKAKAERPPIDIDDEVRGQLTSAVGANRTDRLEKRLRDASRDFERERFADAARILRPLSEQAPGVAAVRELYGLTLYRQGKWRAAAKELEAFRSLVLTTEANPVLADCYRALRQWGKVDELWAELKDESPSAELVTEGRIVVAGSLADRRDLNGAIALLQQGWKFPKRPQDNHLRRAYALADLYERAGDVPRARDLFAQIVAVDPEFSDAGIRLRSLR